MAEGEPADTETGRGLVLVATLSTDWGSFHTPAGKAAYFTLAFQPELPQAATAWPRAATRGDLSHEPRPDSRPQ